MTRRFKPSAFSEGASEPEDAKGLALKLRYICKAAEILEEELAQEALPSWVVRGVNQAAALMGTAVSYVLHVREKRGKKPSEKPGKKKRPRKRKKR